MLSAMELYERLLAYYGKPRWWSEDPYTVMVQAVLVQNTNWNLVEKVTAAMKDRLCPETIGTMEQKELEALIRSCGFAKRKAETILSLTEWYGRYDFLPDKVRERPALREELLQIRGIGAETADVLMVFCFHRASFIIDAYTRRFLDRLGYRFGNDAEIRQFFTEGLPEDYRIYGWFHWLILEHGICFCKKTPSCTDCPMEACSHRSEDQ